MHIICFGILVVVQPLEKVHIFLPLKRYSVGRGAQWVAFPKPLMLVAGSCGGRSSLFGRGYQKTKVGRCLAPQSRL